MLEETYYPYLAFGEVVCLVNCKVFSEHILCGAAWLNAGDAESVTVSEITRIPATESGTVRLAKKAVARILIPEDLRQNQGALYGDGDGDPIKLSIIQRFSGQHTNKKL